MGVFVMGPDLVIHPLPLDQESGSYPFGSLPNDVYRTSGSRIKGIPVFDLEEGIDRVL
jgi:hypothetical protein